MRAGVPFLQVFATDADDLNTVNAQLRFSIVNQIPNPGNVFYFGINPESGEIFITEEGISTHLELKRTQKNPNVYMFLYILLSAKPVFLFKRRWTCVFLLFCRSRVSEGQARCNVQPRGGPWQSWCPEEEVWGLLYSKEQHASGEQPLLYMCRTCWWEHTETHSVIMLLTQLYVVLFVFATLELPTVNRVKWNS